MLGEKGRQGHSVARLLLALCSLEAAVFPRAFSQLDGAVSNVLACGTIKQWSTTVRRVQRMVGEGKGLGREYVEEGRGRKQRRERRYYKGARGSRWMDAPFISLRARR